MHNRINPEHATPLPSDTLVSNRVYEFDPTKEGVVFPHEVAGFVDGQTTTFAGIIVPTKVSMAFNAIRDRASDLGCLETSMSPIQATLLRAALEKYRGHALNLVRLYQQICDVRNVRPDTDDRLSLIDLAKKLKQ